MLSLFPPLFLLTGINLKKITTVSLKIHYGLSQTTLHFDLAGIPETIASFVHKAQCSGVEAGHFGIAAPGVNAQDW